MTAVTSFEAGAVTCKHCGSTIRGHNDKGQCSWINGAIEAFWYPTVPDVPAARVWLARFLLIGFVLLALYGFVTLLDGNPGPSTPPPREVVT